MAEDNTPKVAPATPEDEQEVPTHPTPGVDTTGEAEKGNVVESGEDQSKGKPSKRARKNQ